MRQVHLDLSAGVAGDMLVAGLIDAGAPEEALRAVLDGLPPEFAWRLERCTRQGIAARRFVVDAREGHVHRHFTDVEALLDPLALSERARAWARAAFWELAVAEGRCHDCSPHEVHFHEVGAVDALVDVAGACALLDALDPAAVWASAVGVGSGTVDCAHGRLPVPAPATLELLRGVPLTGRDLQGERATPTGAALLRAWGVRWGGRPPAAPLAVGHGAGSRDTEDMPNFLRVVVEEADGAPEQLLELRALVDVAGACALLDALDPAAVWASAVGVGSGTVDCAHGRLPVPAPATLELLRGVPLTGRDLQGERATPTGAALLRAWGVRWGGRPPAAPLAVGHGAGSRDTEDMPNFLRVVVEEADGAPEQLLELRALVDDQSGEVVGAALEELHAAGAVEAFALPALAKKGRPAFEVVVLAPAGERAAFEERMFRLLGTLGLRVTPAQRTRRPRRVVEAETALGPLPFKERLDPDRARRLKPEFEALRRRAAELGLTPREALEFLTGGDQPPSGSTGP
jgi:uncharacterized protein (DUF111 family)